MAADKWQKEGGGGIMQKNSKVSCNLSQKKNIMYI
jgi:hypothetical protein